MTILNVGNGIGNGTIPQSSTPNYQVDINTAMPKVNEIQEIMAIKKMSIF